MINFVFPFTIDGETKILSVPTGCKYDVPRIYIFKNEKEYENRDTDDKGLYITTSLELAFNKKIQYTGTLEFLGWTIDSYDYIEKLASIIRINLTFFEMLNKKRLNKRRLQYANDYVDAMQLWANIQFNMKPED